MTILSVAYPFARVGPAAVGGAEVVLTTLESAVVEAGLRSLVVAAEGSQTAGTLLPVPAPEGLLTDEIRARTTGEVQRVLDRTFARESISLIHMHGIDFDRYSIPADVSVLVTLHLPPAWYPESIWQLPAQYTLVCVSEAQRRACPAHAQHRLRVVANGVPLPPPRPRPGRHGYALMLSRICPEKNLHTGLDAARMAGLPCVLGGEVFPYDAHLAYHRNEIEPRLGPEAVWPGAITGQRKRRLLAGARAVLIPSLAPETSSLLAMEALAAGTPVVAFRSGALPEVIDEGRTGFLVDSAEGMARALARVGAIDPAHCRAVAAERFSSARMAADYLRLYDHVLTRQPALAERWA